MSSINPKPSNAGQGRPSDGSPAEDGPEAYHVTLKPEAGVCGLLALRHALKRLLRGHGLRCVRVVPEKIQGEDEGTGVVRTDDGEDFIERF